MRTSDYLKAMGIAVLILIGNLMLAFVAVFLYAKIIRTERSSSIEPR